jgi:hypothetical protein
MSDMGGSFPGLAKVRIECTMRLSEYILIHLQLNRLGREAALVFAGWALLAGLGPLGVASFPVAFDATLPVSSVADFLTPGLPRFFGSLGSATGFSSIGSIFCEDLRFDIFALDGLLSVLVTSASSSLATTLVVLAFFEGAALALGLTASSLAFFKRFLGFSSSSSSSSSASFLARDRLPFFGVASVSDW